MIRRNAHKYSISALCKCLGIARSTYYYECKEKPSDTALVEAVKTAYEENRSVYGSRKLKHCLKRKGISVSRRKILQITNRLGLFSAYTRKKYRMKPQKCNQSTGLNHLDRQFNGQKSRAVVVSDLTYVRVGGSWKYICILLDLNNREIIGYSAGHQKDALLVRKAFSSVKTNLFQIQMFHTDRGSEFDNMLIDDLLETFQIKRSLSLKGCPYDNAVAEATFKMIKAEFIYHRQFDSIEQLNYELADYVHWFNHLRLHSALDYLSPVEYHQTHSSSFLSE